jgi:hypothetical protein
VVSLQSGLHWQIAPAQLRLLRLYHQPLSVVSSADLPAEKFKSVAHQRQPDGVLDEIFGRQNFVTSVVWERNGA